MTKKQYSLALWGGAARWFIHIWVLKYLEECNIEIHEISGTSMGAIIAGLYACGKNSDEITQVAKDLNFLKLVDIDLKHWLLKGNKILKKLEELYGNKTIEDAGITLKIVATCLESSQQHVFENIRIADAVRASLSLPWVFIPYKIWENSYIDGGITNNLPISVLDGKHAIGVSALKKIKWPLSRKRKILWVEINKWFFNLNYQIIHRTIVTMMKQNEDRSVEKAKGDFILISPDFWDLDYYTFDKIDDFITLGYNEAKKQLQF